MPRKTKPKVELPFLVGDVVRKKAGAQDRTTEDCPHTLTVTRIIKIPDISEEDKYDTDAVELPYWFWGVDQDGVEFDDKDKYYPGAIWIGFYELDPFLGPAKRAIDEATKV